MKGYPKIWMTLTNFRNGAEDFKEKIDTSILFIYNNKIKKKIFVTFKCTFICM